MEEETEVLVLHEHPKLIDQCCELINSEWPRSHTARRRGLESSCDGLPTCMVLVSKNKILPRVLGHSKISKILSIPQAGFIESVVIDKSLRGKGLGRILMEDTEKHMISIGLKEAHLSTYDQQGFYSRLGYNFCERVSIFGPSILPSLPHINVNKGVKENELSKKDACTPFYPNAPPPPPPPPIPIIKTPSILKNHVPSINGQPKKDFMKKVLVL